MVTATPLTLKLRISPLAVFGVIGVIALAVALPMGFEFRQRVSVGGVTIIEILFYPLLLILVGLRPRTLWPAGHQSICMLLYLFLVWTVGRALVGVIEGNDFVRMLRDVRYYVPLLIVPTLLYWLNQWRPDPAKFLAGFVTTLALGYTVYTAFLLTVVFRPELSDSFMMHSMAYRIGSNTIMIAITLLLLTQWLWSERRVGLAILAMVIASVGVTILLTQSRVTTAMLVILMAMAVALYTVRTFRGRFIKIGASVGGTIVVTLAAAFLVLNALIVDFDNFTQLLLQRIQRDQQGRGVWESLEERSFGTREFRSRVINEASKRPLVGFGEGRGVGPTMSQEDGAYIDSTLITMWFKNGLVGTFLYYAFWIAILARFVKSYLRHKTRWSSALAAIGSASVFVWIMWSSANIFLMYGWVLYPIAGIVATLLFCLKPPHRTQAVWWTASKGQSSAEVASQGS